MKNIEFISESELKVDGVRFVTEKVSEPEFKVGQWGGFRTSDGELYPFLIHHFEGNKVYGQDFKHADDIYRVECQTKIGHLIPVTPAEIESHLRKICDEKYVGKKVRSMHDNFYIQKPISLWGYWAIEDELWYQIGGKSTTNVLVYKQGNFADIILYKKPLPKTREEYKTFLRDWADSSYSDSEFLDEYNFEQ